jgi:hypothetical protein
VKALRNEIVVLVADRRPDVVIIDLEFSESVGIAPADMLAELHPVLARASTRIWIAGLHSQTRTALAHLGSPTGRRLLWSTTKWRSQWVPSPRETKATQDHHPARDPCSERRDQWPSVTCEPVTSCLTTTADPAGGSR